MANDLTAGASFSVPTKKPSFFPRSLNAEIEAHQQHADRLIGQNLAVHGKAHAERQTERLLFKAGQ